ncbi:MAG: ribonuclease HII [Candidatus Omnitrophica bacterium]|nr:ribonuclease HII [Candidatus Omnitrophota bacterium]
MDEAGRGPLAGPVVASAVSLRAFPSDVLIDDSKRLTPRQREDAFRVICRVADWGLGIVEPEVIDRIGIHAATLEAMRRALLALPQRPRWAVIDGPWIPPRFPVRALPVVGGDGKSLSVACASIVAKVVRDRFMTKLHRLLPEYGFIRHKGYGTPEHLNLLKGIGPSSFHRYSFRGVAFVG